MFYFLLMPALLLVVVPEAAQAATCAGCPAIAEINQEIVDFALQELEGGSGGLCKKKVVKVENFSAQVMLWKL